MKKVCLVNYDMSVTGGAEQVTATLANEFSKKYEVHIYSIHGKGKELPYTLNDKVHYHAEFEEDTRMRYMFKRTFKPFKDYVNKHNFDVVITMGNYPAFFVAFTRFFTKAKYVFCDHGALINQWKKQPITTIRYVSAICSHKVVTLTNQTKNDYIQKFHLSKNKVLYIYNWIKQEIIDSRRPYDAESKKILTVGRFGKEKGYDMLVKVAKHILPKYPDWQWHVYGTGPVFDDIKQEVERLGLSNQLILQGNVKDVYKLYNDYSFLVLSSYREGLPLVLLEAKASGLPMVSFDIMTGPNEIITDNKDGFLVRPQNIEEMSQKIEKLIIDQELRVEFSKATLENVNKFNQDEIMKQWAELIDSL